MTASMEVKQVHDPKEMLALARQMEEESAKDYNLWANQCSENNDAGSRKIFEGLVDDEERHFDQYDIEMENIDKYGQNYLALQSIEHSKGVTEGSSEE